MKLRDLKVGCSIDGRTVKEIGELAKVSDSFTVVPVRMQDQRCELLAFKNYGVGGASCTIWKTDSKEARQALDNSITLPQVTRGGSSQLNLEGTSKAGRFHATFYFGEKKDFDGYGDQIAHF